MRLPTLAALLLRAFVGADRVEELLGDLEEVHRERAGRYGAALATIGTTLEAVEFVIAARLVRARQTRATPRRSLPVSWIDLKLGLRMLVKYPGLTIVGGTAMSFAVFVGAVTYELYSQVLHPRLPFEEGHRVVAVTTFDGQAQLQEDRILHDFNVWREELESIQDLGAAEFFRANLEVGGAAGAPIRAAAMTSSAFTMARVRPVLGRTLGAADESHDAQPVAVIGHDVWQIRFDGSPDVVGRSVSVDRVDRIIVGVMPRGFGFPVNEALWIPLQHDSPGEALDGPAVSVFGRLAPGVSVEVAEAELSAYLASRASAAPEIYGHLSGRVLPYADAAFPNPFLEGDGVHLWNVFAGAFLLLVCGNVALLVYARAAARESEVVVRAALGAGRSRVVTQFFLEALVLGAVAGVLGVAAVGWGLDRFVATILDGQLPAFWHQASVSPRTIVYSGLLVLIAAAVAGALPGLRVTAGGLDQRLRRQGRGGGGPGLGGAWTVILVLQIAATVAFPVAGWTMWRSAVLIEAEYQSFEPSQYLSFRTTLSSSPYTDEDFDEYVRRLSLLSQALADRLESEASVAGLAMTRYLPGTHHVVRRIEIDGGGQAPRNRFEESAMGRRLRVAVVTPSFFDVMEQEPLAGRALNDVDAEPGARSVVVNQPFVDDVLGGRNPVGRRLRYLSAPDYMSRGDEWSDVEIADEAGPWYRIVGVVPYLGMGSATRQGSPRAGVYHAATPEDRWGLVWLVRLNERVRIVASRVREVALDIDPDLRIVALRTVEEVKVENVAEQLWFVRFMVTLSGLAILLSLAGVFAVTSFSVTRRTREIGLRVALGARPRQVASSTFRAPLRQILLGLLIGLWGCVLLGPWQEGEGLWGRPLVALLSYTATMAIVCLAACIVPTRRALGIEPAQALGSES